MKVSELIEELQVFKPDLTVRVSDRNKKFYNLEIGTVFSMKGNSELSRSPWIVIEIDADHD